MIPAAGGGARLERLARNWAAYWPDADIDALVDDVLRRRSDAVARWDLTQVVPIAGGEVAAVAAARRNRRHVVLKIHPRGHRGEDELRAEGAALRHWAATGASVALLGDRDGGLTLLLQRLVPGTTLAGSRREETLSVLGGLAARLHAAGPPADDAPFPTGVDYLRRGLGDDAAALEELDALAASAGPPVLLHDDLHPLNVLRGGEDWLAIDPHAVMGEPAADVWALVNPLAPELPEDDDEARLTARARVAQYARAMDVDPDRVAGWAALRALVESRWVERRAASGGVPPDEERWAARMRRLAGAVRPP